MAGENSQTLDELRKVARTFPIIDNHAHNLLRPAQLKTANFLSITSEAEGEALHDHTAALPHFRAVKQLRKLYELPSDAGWDNILKKRRELLEHDPAGLIKRCLEGTYTILIDDGLDGVFERYDWHDQFTAAPCKRIVRIEAVAAEILSALHQQGKLPVGTTAADEGACSISWVAFITAFEQAIAAYLEDDEVVGFKSVVCYRTGLNVQVGRDIEVTEAGLRSFRRHFLPHCTRTGFRVEAKGMNDALVISACKLITAYSNNSGKAKPLQFHTGLGDNDIALLDSNPACLQPLIKHFPNVPIVLLHSSYPYTREAGYLATVYQNVYLDIGEVFPQVSRDGQEQIVRQALEITPTSKILWSTDGHHHPETYWLANVQGREAIELVFCEYVEKEDLTVTQAIRAITDIFFGNANALYGLDLKPPTSDSYAESTSTPAPSDQGRLEQQALNSAHGPAFSSSRTPMSHFATKYLNSTLTPDTSHCVVSVQWLDYMAQVRCRWVPIKEFKRLMEPGPVRIAISKGNLGTTQNDHMSSLCDPVGSIYVEPDLQSFRPMQSTGNIKNAATLMSRFVTEDGVGLEMCPRSTLQRLVNAFEEQYNMHLLVGFEIEITFCKRDPPVSGEFRPIDKNHAWGTFSDEQYTRSFGLMASIADELSKIGIPIQQFHSEAGAGQYEFVLAPLPPILAVDTLIQARQCIQQIAANNDLRATCHPSPFSGIGTAAHAHVSLNSDGLDAQVLEEREWKFVAGLLKHMWACAAITMPQEESYTRVMDNGWTGGTWVAWGTNNRETPLRRVAPQRWEIRCLDGTANMYLAIAVVLAAGLDGLRQDFELTSRDCTKNPAKLSESEREELGIVERMPMSLEDSLDALQKDTVLREVMGNELMNMWMAVKTAEQQMLEEMGKETSNEWLIERY